MIGFKVPSFALLIFLATSSAFARGGGHVTTWDPNLFGGGWVCFGAQVTGCSQGFNAACSPNGTSGSDAAALNAFNTFAAAQNPALVKLYIAPGAVCHTEGSTVSFGSGVQNLIVWGYGARISNQNFGGADYYTDAVHQARVTTVSAGSSTVSLITPSDISRFSVGAWTVMTGDSLQPDSYATNWQFYEYKLITNISTDCPTPCTTATVTFNEPLVNSYKSTWPYLGVGSAGNDLGGPATLFALLPTYLTNTQIFGLSVMTGGPAGSNVTGRDITFVDVNHEGAGWGFRGTHLNLFFTNIPGGTEFDKDMIDVNIYRSSVQGNGLFFADPSPLNLTISGVSAPSINGTGKNFFGSNLTISTNISVGTGFYGASSTAKLDGVSFQGQHSYFASIDKSSTSFANGTFTILKSDPEHNTAHAVFSVGNKNYFGQAQGSNFNCSPNTTFTVIDLREDASNLFIDTDLGNTLPTVLCAGVPYTTYGSYHLQNAPVLLNSGPGTFPDSETHPP